MRTGSASKVDMREMIVNAGRTETGGAELTKSTLSGYYERYACFNFKINEGDHVLDLGFGLGNTFVPDKNNKDLISAVGPSGRVVGVEINPKNIRATARKIADYLAKSGLGKEYALLVLRSARELRETKRILEVAAEQELIRKDAARGLFRLIDEKNNLRENIKELEASIGKRLIILYYIDAQSMDICPQDYFDKIIEFGSLRNMAQPFEAIKKCALALKRGGLGYFSEFSVVQGTFIGVRGFPFLKEIRGLTIKEELTGSGWLYQLTKTGSNKQIIGSRWPTLDSGFQIHL